MQLRKQNPQANLDKLTMTLDSKDNSYEFVMPDGTTVSGTYELDDKGIYTFTNGVPTYHIGGGDIMFAATAENQLRILQVNMLGDVLQGMWLGQRSTEKDEYIAYHFIPAAGSGTTEPEYTTIAVDNSKLVWGDLEDNNDNFRIELYNIFGATGGGSESAPEYTDASPLDPTSIVFNNQMEVTFTISGLTGAAATGEYEAQLANCTAPGWWPNVGEDIPSVTVKGDGTYTITYNTANAYTSGVIVFCIDIINMAPDIADPSAVSVTIDSLRII